MASTSEDTDGVNGEDICVGNDALVNVLEMNKVNILVQVKQMLPGKLKKAKSKVGVKSKI